MFAAFNVLEDDRGGLPESAPEFRLLIAKRHRRWSCI